MLVLQNMSGVVNAQGESVRPVQLPTSGVVNDGKVVQIDTVTSSLGTIDKYLNGKRVMTWSDLRVRYYNYDKRLEEADVNSIVSFNPDRLMKSTNYLARMMSWMAGIALMMGIVSIMLALWSRCLFLANIILHNRKMLRSHQMAQKVSHQHPV